MVGWLNRAIVFSVLVGLAPGSSRAEEPSSEGSPPSRLPSSLRYVNDIRPLLLEHCGACHGPDQHESGLRVDELTWLIDGGDRGPAVIAGRSGESLLWQAIQGTSSDLPRMPPEATASVLAPEAQELVRDWIDHGLAHEAIPAVRPPHTHPHWAFQPPRESSPPRLRDPSRTAHRLDAYWLARVEAAERQPAQRADARMLIRRLSWDLLGLPPTYEETEAFVADRRPDAYARLIDRLFASPAYGERWGRHWLDVARYADSNGYTRDSGRDMSLYRDWVIAAMNRSQPFDQFVIEQLAGDLLPQPTADQLIATGFHRNTLTNEEGGTDAEQFRVDAVADRVATTGEGLLGLTLACARCHSHKYDPISQREYYQLFALFNDCDEMLLEVPTARQLADGVLAQRNSIRAQIDQLEKELAQHQSAYDTAQTAWEDTITPEQRMRLSTPVQDALQKDLEARNATEKQLVSDVYRQTDGARQQFPQIDAIARLRTTEPKIRQAMVLRARSEPRATFVHLRGDFLQSGPPVVPGWPSILPAVEHGTTQRLTRLDFARSLFAPRHPLTARVMMNRVWQHFFGVGLIETENDLGTQGARPTNPELLDYLAIEFERLEWDLKAIQRWIVTSAVYQQTSHVSPEAQAFDPLNQLFLRQGRVRLDAEIIRDNSLSVSGLLTRTIGGPSVFPPQPDGVFQFTQDPKPWNTATGSDRYRRGMYTHFWRSSPYPALVVFDAPNANVTCTRRLRSNTPLQSLTLANDVQFIECARAIGYIVVQGIDQRATDSTSSKIRDDRAGITRLFQTMLHRRPHDGELELLLPAIQVYRDHFEHDPKRAQTLMECSETLPTASIEPAVWTCLARTLMNLDEFVTRE